MFTKFISKNIQEKLKSKERALGWKTLNTNQPTKPEGSVIEALRPKDIMSRTTFVRMCSNKAEVDNIVISGGELGEDGLLRFGTDLYASRAGADASQFRPIGGVKDISVEYKGGFKAIRQCTVNWMVNSLGDLEKLTPYFLSVGKTVVVDWGWVNSNTVTFEVPPFITKDTEGKFQVDQTIFVNPQEKILDMKGDYDAMGGYVSNFSYDLREDGGFDCVTTIIGLGANLFDIPLDKGHNAAGSLVLNKDGSTEEANENTNSDKPLVYVPPDNLVNAVINMKRIIYHSIFKLSWISDYSWKQIDVYKDKVGREAIDSLEEETGYGRKEVEYYALFGKDGASAISKKLQGRSRNINLIFPNDGKGLDDYESYLIYKGKEKGWRGWDAVFVDNTTSPNVMIQTDINFKSEYFVTWGWFEDQFLNRYISFMAGEDKDAKLTFRSLDTVLHTKQTNENKIGEPVSSEYLKKSLDALSGLDNFSVKREQMIRQFGIYLDADIDSTNFNDVVKIPTLIRNPPFLHPIDPNKFFIKETLPTETISDYGPEKAYNEDRIWTTTQRSKDGKRKLKSYEAIASDENIRAFAYEGDDDDVKPKGVLRNIWINIKEIQKAFGVNEPDAPVQDEGNVQPPGTLENGVKNLLTAMNSNFNNVWNFEVVTDPYDSTNIKVMDKKSSNVNSPAYTVFQENSHAIESQGIYRFPSFNIGSIVKNQNLSFKIPSAMAVSALYASNKEKGMSNESEYNGSEISKLFRRDEVVDGSDPFKDKYLQSLKKSFQSGDHDPDKPVPFKAIPVGSEYSSYNSKIVKGNNKGSFNVLQFPWDRNWWKRWVSGNKSKEDATTTKTTKAVPPKERVGVRLNDKGETVLVWEIESAYVKGEPVAKAGTDQYLVNESRKGGFYEFDEKLQKYVLIDEAKYALRSYLNNSGGRGKFSSDDIIPAELSLEIDGTGGIMPGDIIQTDYIQPKYNANIVKDTVSYGPQVYFQIFGLNQKVDSGGWTTEINTKMRYNSVPNEKGLSIEKVVSKPIENLTKTQQPPAQAPEQPGVLGPDSAFSGFGLNNTFTLPPLETFKPKADPEDYIAPVPDPDEAPNVQDNEEEFVPPVVINNGIPPEEDGIDTPVPEKPQEVEVATDSDQEMEIIRVVKTSPGQPRIPMPVVVKTVKPPIVATQEVTVVEYTQPEVAYEKVPEPPKKKVTRETPPPPTPPKIMETPTQKVKREQRQKAPKRKSNPVPAKTTYKADGPDNRIIYRIIPLWRTEYASTQAQRNNGDYKQQKIYGEASGKTPVPKAVRQAFWDDNIEAPNSTGISNRTIVDSNEATLVSSGRYFSSTYIAKYDNR